MSEIRVSPIDGDNALRVNGFRIEITIRNHPEYSAVLVLVYRVWRKGTHIETYKTLQEAVEWCSE